MHDGGLVDQPPLGLELLDNAFVGIFDKLPLEVRDTAREAAIGVQRVDQRDARVAADSEVILAVGGGHMDQTGTVLGGHERVIENTEGILRFGKIRQQRLILPPIQVRTTIGLEDLVLVLVLVDRRQTGRGEDVDLAGRNVTYGDILDIRPGTNGQVRRQRPGGRGPE